MRDEMGVDDNLVCVPLRDPGWSGTERLDDLPRRLRDEIAHFFSVYKDLEPEKHVAVEGWPLRGSSRACNPLRGAHHQLPRHHQLQSCKVCAGRGYEPSEDEAGVIRLRNCPFHRLAADHRDLVCGMNRAYLEGLLEGLDRDDATAELDPQPGRCCVAIRSRAKR